MEYMHRLGMCADRGLRFLPYYIFLPHIIPVSSVRYKVEKDCTPSAELLLAIQYLLSLRLSFSSRDMIIAKVQRAHHEASIVQEKLKALIKEGAEDMLLSLTIDKDDYAVQALELLWCYFPLALERLPTKRWGASILGQEFLTSAIAASRLMHHNKLSTAVCSLRYWQTVAVDSQNPASEKARLKTITKADLESLSDTTLLINSAAWRHFHPPEASTALEENIRKAGRIALIARLQIAIKGEETISHALKYQARPCEDLSNLTRIKNLSELLNTLLSSTAKVYDTGVRHLGKCDRIMEPHTAAVS